MPINQADARQLASVILAAYFEDYDTIANLLRPLRQQWPTIDWMAALGDVARTHQAFVDSGLSVEWWLAVVDARSTP